VNTVSDKVVRHSLAYLTVQNGSRGTSPTTWKCGRNWPNPFKNAYFQSIFALSASSCNT